MLSSFSIVHGIFYGPWYAKGKKIQVLTVRAPDKREYWVIIWGNFLYFCIKTYVVTPHLNRLDETVQMRGHNITFK